ncbi:hypothetical protein BHE74_00026887 [Ensete ventricosum]|nr:hypothetical protein BHE74_00026887 [Ensete ventricosum]
MHAQVGTVRDAELRVKIVEERARFDRDPKGFRESYRAEQEKLQQQIASARSSLASVQIDRDLRVKISKVCAELNVDGLRGDIVTNRAAKALAALKGRDKVTAEDIATVIPNCLRHRLRKDPLESIDSGLLVIEKFYEKKRKSASPACPSGSLGSVAARGSRATFLPARGEIEATWARNEFEESDDKVSGSGQLTGAGGVSVVLCSGGGHLAPNDSSSSGGYSEKATKQVHSGKVVRKLVKRPITMQTIKMTKISAEKSQVKCLM